LACEGAFLAIGTVPNTELIKNIVELDNAGYAITDISLSTKARGLFVAGEVIKGNRRQVSISVGMGVQASLACEDYLASLE
jgi:thioredoxin reductase (NADPH)